MSTPYIGEIRMFGFGRTPNGWQACDGSLLPIAQNQALFSLLGTQYGGNGITNFALPDLRSRTPVGYASSVQIGQSSGAENVTLLSTNLPSHTHSVNASTTAGDNRNPSTRVFATSTNTSPNAPVNMYAPSTGALVPLNAQTVSPTGGNQPHPNLQPYSVINFCIALSGIFPSRP